MEGGGTFLFSFLRVILPVMEAVLDLLLSVSVYFEKFFFWFFSQFWINYLAGGARMEKYLVPLLPLLFIFLNQLVITKGTYFWRKHLQGSPSNGCAKKAKMLNSSLLFLPQLCMINIHVSTKFKNILMKTEHLPALVLKYHYFTSSEE